VDEAACLRGDGLDHLGVGVADRCDAEAGGEVDEPVAVGVEDVGAPRLGPEDGVGGACCCAGSRCSYGATTGTYRRPS
jgi:hypothetical protein